MTLTLSFLICSISFFAFGSTFQKSDCEKGDLTQVIESTLNIRESLVRAQLSHFGQNVAQEFLDQMRAVNRIELAGLQAENLHQLCLENLAALDKFLLQCAKEIYRK